MRSDALRRRAARPTTARTRLYLQTEHLDGGLYAALGRTRVRLYREGGIDQIVMVKEVVPPVVR